MQLKIIRRARNAFLRFRLRRKPLEKAFTYIYANNQWGHVDSVSGHGSSLAKTRSVRERLPEINQQFAVKSILDVPCGDFHWMKEVDLTGIFYTGGDIVQALVRKNQRLYGGTGRRFISLDASADAVPKADLIICRDLLIHLPLATGVRVLQNLCASGSGFLLTTSYVFEPLNRDIPAGGWRPINLKKPRCSFPAPLASIDDGDSDPALQDYGKSLLLWRLGDLEAGLAAVSFGTR